MPVRPRIAACIAALVLAVPSSALAQSGGGGAGDSQYQDPFGTSTQATPKAPAKPKAPAAQQSTTQAAPAPAQAAPAPATTQAGSAAGSAPAPAAASADPQGTLPRTGFDVVPLAVAGLVLLLGGLALWRRPHADR